LKWPKDITLVRHGQSAYNILKSQRDQDPEYQQFKLLFDKDPTSQDCVALAQIMQQRYALGISDQDTPVLDGEASEAAVKVGAALQPRFPVPPNAVYVSPYQRTVTTLELMSQGWPALAQVRQRRDERLREQEHGIVTMYNDWRVFQVLHPEQRLYYNLAGPYRYRYPQGENVPDVRDRIASWFTTLVREHAGERILVVTHHLAILAIRANLERLSEQQFIDLDEHHKPINCGVTTYVCDPGIGRQGKLILEQYNEQLY